MLTIAHAGQESRSTLQLVQKNLAFEAVRKGKTAPSWISLDWVSLHSTPCDMLCVTDNCLRTYHQDPEFPVPWRDINIVVLETYWQLLWYRALFDTSKQYILILDSWLSKRDFQRNFHWLPVLGRFAFKYDVHLILQLLSNGSPLWYPARTSQHDRCYNTFALIGRQDAYRDEFVNLLTQSDLPDSMIKYNGKTVHDRAPDFDSRPYNRDEFYQNDGDDWMTGSFDIQRAFYENFRFETAVETTQWHHGGWPVCEYDITEKSLKPMMLGMPVMMLGPRGYNTWLQDQFGIDLAMGLFTPGFDRELSDRRRMMFAVDLVRTVATSRDLDPDPAAASRNRQGLMAIMDWNLQEISSCAELILDIANNRS